MEKKPLNIIARIIERISIQWNELGTTLEGETMSLVMSSAEVEMMIQSPCCQISALYLTI